MHDEERERGPKCCTSFIHRSHHLHLPVSGGSSLLPSPHTPLPLFWSGVRVSSLEPFFPPLFCLFFLGTVSELNWSPPASVYAASAKRHSALFVMWALAPLAWYTTERANADTYPRRLFLEQGHLYTVVSRGRCHLVGQQRHPVSSDIRRLSLKRP